MTTSQQQRVVHVIVPQREGAIGGADLHVLDLAVAQQQASRWHPTVLAARAPRHYLDRLANARLRTATKWHPTALRNLVRDHGVDLLHAHGYEANYIVAGMRRLSSHWARLPTVITAHGWIETTPWLRVKSGLDRACGRIAHVRIATAHAHVGGLADGRGEAVVIHNGVPEPDLGVIACRRSHRKRLLSTLGVPADHMLIGMVGRLSAEKRGDLFLSAARHVADQHPHAHFIVVGGGDEHTQLNETAARLGLQGQVTFTGLLSDVTIVYAALDVLVQPSDTEGTPRTVLEAMAHRVPVVATRVGDVAELLDNGAAGALVPVGDHEALARGVLHLLGDRRHARVQAERAHRRYRERYTISAMARQVEGAYATAVRLAACEMR